MASDKPTDAHILRMTAYPPGYGPYERWEVTFEATGELIIKGDMPVDQDAVRSACSAYHHRLEEANRIARITREISNG